MSEPRWGKPPTWLLVATGAMALGMTLYGLWVVRSYSFATFWLVLSLFTLSRVGKR